MKFDLLIKPHRGARLEWYKCAPRKFALAAALSLLAAVAWPLPASAVAITGIVTNGTTEKADAGDPVVLIALDRSMQEIGSTKTNAQGHYSIDAPASGMHLIRVDHQGVAYFQTVQANSPVVNVQVFDVAAAVAGVDTEANVMRMETDAQGLKVTENFFVKNGSSPPRTQFSAHAYELYLPSGAQIESSAALAPGSMPVQSSPVSLGKKGLYAFLFPLRPGETQFQLAYHLPYAGTLSFTPHLATAVDNFVVILPKTMTFKAGAESPFQIFQPPQQVAENAGTQTYLARNIKAAQPLSFSVSGSGVMPRDQETAGNQGGPDQGAASPEGGASSQGSSSTDARPGIGLANPIDTPDPLYKARGWILGGLTILLAIAAFYFLRRPANEPPVAAAGHPIPPARPGAVRGESPDNMLLTALKDELFAIETDRAQGRLSSADYDRLKSALELVLHRALTRC